MDGALDYSHDHSGTASLFTPAKKRVNEASVKHVGVGVGVCAAVQFSLDSIREFNYRIKIRENRGLGAVSLNSQKETWT